MDDRKICHLEIVKHLEGLRQPRDLALLNSVQECISTSIVLDSTLTTSISSQVNMCFDYFFREIIFTKFFGEKDFHEKSIKFS